mmetsp:Transcript_33039/g.77259  ORF Transcript_33039/g.77259 Transcript_33039/m.77259 type:complete len:80 (-) Transcript_33039:14-253(-)
MLKLRVDLCTMIDGDMLLATGPVSMHIASCDVTMCWRIRSLARCHRPSLCCDLSLRPHPSECGRHAMMLPVSNVEFVWS